MAMPTHECCMTKADRTVASGSLIAWSDAWISPAFENVISLCMSKPKLIWEYLNDLPNLRPSLEEAHIDVLTAGIPRYLGIILCSVGIVARPGSTMPSCALLWIQAQEGETIRARRHRHLPRPNENAGVRQGVITLVRIDEHYECDGYHDARSDNEHLLGGRPSVYTEKHLTRKK